MLQPLTDFPRPCADGHCDFLLLYQGASQPHLLVYEKHRDFLSAPRSYLVVALHCHGSALVLASDAQYPGVEYDELGNMLEVGLFYLGDSEHADEEQLHLLISFPSQCIEALIDGIELQAEILANSAQAALQQVLAAG